MLVNRECAAQFKISSASSSLRVADPTTRFRRAVQHGPPCYTTNRQICMTERRPVARAAANDTRALQRPVALYACLLSPPVRPLPARDSAVDTVAPTTDRPPASHQRSAAAVAPISLASVLSLTLVLVLVSNTGTLPALSSTYPHPFASRRRYGYARSRSTLMPCATCPGNVPAGHTCPSTGACMHVCRWHDRSRNPPSTGLAA